MLCHITRWANNVVFCEVDFLSKLFNAAKIAIGPSGS